MNQKLSSREWIPRGSRPQYHVREIIGREIEQRTREDRSLDPGFIQRLEEERAYMNYSDIYSFADALSESLWEMIAESHIQAPAVG
jgi:hypothetical protein